MYSSMLGAIVTDPALMVLPLDDPMVHRGHAVFDTATLTHRMLYQLDAHLDRLLRSAEGARIPLRFRASACAKLFSLPRRRAAGATDRCRYWLSAGPGGFALGPAECVGSSFYVIVFKQEAYPESYYRNGVKLVTSRCRSSRRCSRASNRPIICLMCSSSWKPRTPAPTTAFSSTRAAGWRRAPI